MAVMSSRDKWNIRSPRSGEVLRFQSVSFTTWPSRVLMARSQTYIVLVVGKTTESERRA